MNAYLRGSASTGNRPIWRTKLLIFCGYGPRGHALGGDIDGFLRKKNGKYAFHNAYLPHRTYIEMKKLS